ncbi:hypothetical protein D3C83_130110 [compost metagenome]
MKPISSGSKPYSTGSSSLALPLSGLLTESVSLPSVMESFTARPLSLESVETRSTASAKALLSTSMVLSFPCGITRS